MPVTKDDIRELLGRVRRGLPMQRAQVQTAVEIRRNADLSERFRWQNEIKVYRFHGDLGDEMVVQASRWFDLAAQYMRLGAFREYFSCIEKAERFCYGVYANIGNTGLNEGLNEIWDAVAEQNTPVEYSNANARVGVGNDATAPSASQTGLLGGSTAYKAMDVSYPTTGTSQQIVFKGTYGSAEANFAWNEQTVDNGNTDNKNLFRANTSLGTKTTGSWSLQATLTLS